MPFLKALVAVIFFLFEQNLFVMPVSCHHKIYHKINLLRVRGYTLRMTCETQAFTCWFKKIFSKLWINANYLLHVQDTQI